MAERDVQRNESLWIDKSRTFQDPFDIALSNMDSAWGVF